MKAAFRTIIFSRLSSSITGLAYGWLILFTITAAFSHIWVSSGNNLVAVPEEAYLSPFNNPQHLLGTDQLGRDVATYLFLSCRTAWLLAFPPLVLATALGLLLGTAAAILGNTGFTLSLHQIISFTFTLLLAAFFYPVFYYRIVPEFLFNLESFLTPHLLFFSFLGLFYKSCLFLLRSLFLKQYLIPVPIDKGLRKVIDMWSTFPKLLLLLIFTTFTPFSILSLMGWICATYWVLPARVARASVLQIKQEAYFETTTSLGLPFKTTLAHHIWPFLKAPILTTFCFAASGLLGIGSTLAYIGIGLPADIPSWGKMLAVARFSVEAWWLFVFPALLLLLSIFSLQAIGHRISHARGTNHVKN